MNSETQTTTSKTVEVHGNPVSVTPIEHLDDIRSLACQIGVQRITRAAEREDHEELATAIIELLEVCINDGVTVDTLESLSIKELSRLLEAALSGQLG